MNTSHERSSRSRGARNFRCRLRDIGGPISTATALNGRRSPLFIVMEGGSEPRRVIMPTNDLGNVFWASAYAVKRLPF